MSSRISLPTLAWLLCVSVFLSAGCNDSRLATVPVSGTVTFADGTPVSGGQIELESIEHGVNARSPLSTDGEFRLTTYRDGDGAVVGAHRVIVLTPPSAFVGVQGSGKHGPHGPRLRRVPRRFADYSASKLTMNVDGSGPQEVTVIIPDE